MFDAIVVGARCAGSSTAMLLARRGHRVLVVDKGSFPSDVLSTHFLWPRGASYLNKWGLLDRLLATTPSGRELNMTIEGIHLQGSIPLEAVQHRLRRVHGEDATGYAVQTYCSPRRRVLDELLVQGAREAGAEVRLGFTVEDLLVEDGRVVGIRGHTQEGTPVTERARVVVGADGRRSVVAQALKVQKYDERQRCTFAYFSYFSGFSLGGAQLFKRGRFGLAVVPTNFNHNMTLVWGPHHWFEDFLQGAEANFFKVIDYVAPHVGEIIRAAGKREEKFYGTADQAAYSRKSYGAGWALAGDAACFKDQCTAMGMTHAFRDAELLSAAIHRGLAEEAPLDKALEDYQWRRNEDTTSYLDFVGAQAEMNPARPDELELFLSLRDNPTQTDRFFACYGDTLPVSDFFSLSNLSKIRRDAPPEVFEHPLVRNADQRWERAFINPFRTQEGLSAEAISLSRTSFDFMRLSGPDLLGRTEGYHQWLSTRMQTQTWPFSRTLKSVAAPQALIQNEAGRTVEGVNFASQDYLSLNTHPAIHEAAARAVRDFGPHSAGSPQLIGNTSPSLALEAMLADMLQMEHVMLFPTGWAAGFGAIAGLVRPDDHIVLDKLAHACLQQGAYASTKNVTRHVHGHLDSLRERLRTIRNRDTRNAVLVVTEGLFSMDSDCPDIERIQALCREYDATLLVDVAHDFGSMGPGGGGQLAVQQMLGKVDLVMGSFSKTFASNGGFLATRSLAVKNYVKMFGGPHAFSNALSPVQAAVVLEAARIVRSSEGDALRGKLEVAVRSLRDELQGQYLTCMGVPSAIVPVWVGDERVLRLMYRKVLDQHVHANAVEFPAVSAGSARFRLQVMSSHTSEHTRQAAVALGRAWREANAYLEALGRPPKATSRTEGEEGSVLLPGWAKGAARSRVEVDR